MKSIRSILHILLGVTLICSCNEATELAHITPNVSLIKYKDIVKIDSLYTYPGDSLYQNWINQYNKNLEDKTSRSLSPEDDAFFNKQYTTVQRNYPIGSVDLNRNHSSDVLV